MKYFLSLTEADLIELILSTTTDLYLCLPSIHKGVRYALLQLRESNDEVKINVLIDFDSQTFRQGYGDFDSVKELKQKNISIESLPDNRVSFIIAGNVGYYLFIESRSLIPADKSTINAITIDAISLIRLKHYFFYGVGSNKIEDDLTNAIIKESKLLTNSAELLEEQCAFTTEINTAQIAKVDEELKLNPPINPDYKRIVDIYSSKFQYVRLNFIGANLRHKRIKFPANALPFEDANLKKRLETKLELFSKEDLDQFKELTQFNERLDDIRNTFLLKVKSRQESVLKYSKKEEFQKRVAELGETIEQVKKDLLHQISFLITKAKKNVQKELMSFFIANPKSLFPNREDLGSEHEALIANEATLQTEEITNRNMKWPRASKLVDGLSLKVQYSDITIEDLNNQEFILELKEHGLIDTAEANQLADFNSAIEL